jgi:hypothetical protein
MSNRLKNIEAQAAMAGLQLRTAYVLTDGSTTMWFPCLDSVQAALDTLAESPYVTAPVVPANCPCLKK